MVLKSQSIKACKIIIRYIILIQIKDIAYLGQMKLEKKMELHLKGLRGFLNYFTQTEQVPKHIY